MKHRCPICNKIVNVSPTDKSEEADIILFGAAVDQGTENPSCADAPSKVREHLDNFYFSENANTNSVIDKSDIV